MKNIQFFLFHFLEPKFSYIINLKMLLHGNRNISRHFFAKTFFARGPCQSKSTNFLKKLLDITQKCFVGCHNWETFSFIFWIGQWYAIKMSNILKVKFFCSQYLNLVTYSVTMKICKKSILWKNGFLQVFWLRKVECISGLQCYFLIIALRTTFLRQVDRTRKTIFMVYICFQFQNIFHQAKCLKQPSQFVLQKVTAKVAINLTVNTIVSPAINSATKKWGSKIFSYVSAPGKI